MKKKKKKKKKEDGLEIYIVPQDSSNTNKYWELPIVAAYR